MVSNASDDLPEPESPVKTMSRSRGRSRSTLRRLCSRAPEMTRRLLTEASYDRPPTFAQVFDVTVAAPRRTLTAGARRSSGRRRTRHTDAMTYTGRVVVGGPGDLRRLDAVEIRKLAVGPLANDVYLLTCRRTGAQVLV